LGKKKKKKTPRVSSAFYHIVFSPADQKRSARQKPQNDLMRPTTLAQILFPTRPTGASRFEHRFTMFWLGRDGGLRETGSWEMKSQYRGLLRNHIAKLKDEFAARGGLSQTPWWRRSRRARLEPGRYLKQERIPSQSSEAFCSRGQSTCADLAEDYPL
jgi:hypothetical protein